MGIFSSIKDAIFGKAKAAPAPAEATPQPEAAAAQPTPQPQPTPEPQEVDIEAILVELDSNDDRDLNWRNSIVDLMKLVGLESSFAERKELAQELGYTGDLDGSAEMNIWLHKRVMQELAANGGKVPASMLD
ncbi:DUF3597 domain-containing protein [Sphingomonas sp. MS122]|uniref:DUF3597 domain-containing protein n=1 Tax=Sphingomonas sp. MS122 TaxID=3412683 RepID=UPI003C2EE42D